MKTIFNSKGDLLIMNSKAEELDIKVYKYHSMKYYKELGIYLN
ncbi:hypothetical protein [Brachyspira sp.]